MLLVGFRGLTVDQAPEVVADIRDHNLGGVLLYDTDLPTHSAIRNIRDPAQLKSLVAGLKALASTPLLVAVDEEGGLLASTSGMASPRPTPRRSSERATIRPSPDCRGRRSRRRFGQSASTSTWRRWSIST